MTPLFISQCAYYSLDYNIAGVRKQKTNSGSVSLWLKLLFIIGC